MCERFVPEAAFMPPRRAIRASSVRETFWGLTPILPFLGSDPRAYRHGVRQGSPAALRRRRCAHHARAWRRCARSRRSRETPFTSTCGMPTQNERGSSYVAVSRTVSGSKQTMSAAMPGRSRPRSGRRRIRAGSDVKRRDGVLEPQQPELAHVDGEVPRERPPAPRVRPVADQDAVGAARVTRVLHDRAHVLLVADVVRRREREAAVGAELAVHVDWPTAGLLGPLRDRAAAGDDERPVHRHAVVAVGAHVLQFVAEPLAQVGIAQPRESWRPRRPPSPSPAGRRAGTSSRPGTGRCPG